MDRQRMRSPLARAMGLGSAREGVEHWWMERVSAVALVPLTMWFVAAIIAHTGSDYASFIAWLRTPLASILMILLLIALFYHTALGLQVVIEDYVHSGAKFVALVAVRLGCFALAAQESWPPCASPLAAERGGARAQKRATKMAQRMTAASARNGCAHPGRVLSDEPASPEPLGPMRMQVEFYNQLPDL